ncbi:MAG: dTDP-glucose 4,6-dehydratase [Thermoplasmataceae archaeon]
MKMIVTGGLGFIGSNFIRSRIKNHPEDEIINVDKITYASNPLNRELKNHQSYTFIKGDIADYDFMKSVAKDVDCIVNFAAESHVDNSILSSDQFVQSNIVGVHSLLKVTKDYGIRFHHISTDEVYGTLPVDSEEKFHDSSPYKPRNPYSATKASSDFLVRAFCNTYGIRATISNCSNNYGPYQHPEKLIPKTILNAVAGRKIQLYGNGEQVRDWIHVEDHCSAVSLIVDKGVAGNTYLIGGNNEVRNNEVVKKILGLLNKPTDMIEYVRDRPGHDVRYAIETSPSLIRMGWKKSVCFDSGLQETINHYLSNMNVYNEHEKWSGEWH